MPERPERQRALRRDAIINRERLLRAALELLPPQDSFVSLKEVAAQAGLGVGTVYRHFPTEEDLARALYDRMAAGLAGRLGDAPAGETAWDSLTGLIEHFTFAVADQPGLRTVMRRIYQIDPGYAPARGQVPGLQELIAQAQADGDMRPDITAGDVALVPFLVGTFSGDLTAGERSMLRRQLTYILDGMSARGTVSEVADRELSVEEFHRFVHRPVRQGVAEPPDS